MESIENIDFHKYWCTLKRRWLPAVVSFSAVVTLTYLYTSSKVPVYSAQGQLLLKQDKSSSLTGLDSAKQVNSQNDSPQSTEIWIIRSAQVLQKALSRINQSNPQGTPLNLADLQQGLDITGIEGTDIFQVTYKSTNPQVAALVVNQVMDTYVDNNLLTNRAAATSAGDFIVGQLPMVKANVQRAEAALRNFKEKNRITDLGQTQLSVAANIERIKSQIDAIETQLGDLDSRSTALQTKLGMSSQQAIAAGSISQSPAVQGVLTDFQLVQRQLADARSRYQEGNPIIVRLKDKEAQLKTLLQTQVAQVLQGQKTSSNSKLQVGPIQQGLIAELIKLEVDRVGLVNQKVTLRNQQALYQQQAAMLPKLEQQQRENLRELSAAQSTYETLLKNLQEIKVIENRTVSNVQIIESAQVPTGPINADKTSALAAGTLAGILLAASVIYILEMGDKRIKTVKEAREIFEYKLLSTIPVFGETTTTLNVDKASGKKSILPVVDSPRSAASESYRMIQANLMFANPNKALKVIVVTSSVPGEGKSTTCANLAAVMMQLGYKVLIIDADIRHPSQQDIWQVPNTVGLINIISGQTELSDTVIQKVRNNLSVLTAGVSSSSVDVFLDSRNMAALIEQCPKQYDYMIIDTPPLAVTADASAIGKIADGVVLITRPDMADAASSRLAKECLDQSGQNILGIVVNGVIPENEPSSYYYYSGYHYQELASKGYTSSEKKNWIDSLSFFKRKRS